MEIMSTNTWKVDADGDWSTVADWSLGRLPASGDTVEISTTDVHTITHNSGSDTINKLVVGADFFSLGGGSLDILSTASFADGYTQNGGTLTAGAVTITGPAKLLGGVSEGATAFAVTGTTTLSNYTLGGASSLAVKTTANQTGGITLGDATDVGAAITVASGGAYNIAGDFNIGQGASSATFTNAGTLQKTSGSGASVVGVSVVSTGTLAAASGELEFEGPTNTISGTLSGAGQIAFGAGVTTLGKVTVTAATLGIYGTATVDIQDSFNLSSVFIDESTGTSTLNLAAENLDLSGASAALIGSDGSADVTGSGALSNKSVLTLSAVDIGGTLKFNNYDTIDQTGQVTVGDGSGNAPTITNEVGGVYDFTDDAALGQDNATTSFVNKGTLEKTGGVNGSPGSVISVAVTNSGTISAQTGALNFIGSLVNTGTISGAGAVEVTSAGSLTLNAGSVLSVANFDLFNTASLTLGTSLTYAGVFNDTSSGPDEINLGANTLTLTGSSNTFQGTDGATDIAGTGKVVNSGVLSIGGAVIDGTTEIDNTGTINQASSITIGGSGGQVASIVNAAGATFNVSGALEIGDGAATSSHFDNSGTVAVSGGTGQAIFATTFNNLTGGVLNVATGTLDSVGVLTNAGTISGTELELSQSGQTTFNTGSTLSVAEIDLTDTALLTLTKSITYTGEFEDDSSGNDEINLKTTTLKLSGQADFNSSDGDDVVTGSGVLELANTSTLSGTLEIGSTASLEVARLLTVSGSLQVGDGGANAATATITSAGTYELIADGGVGRGSSAASTVTNAGLFEKTAGTGTSVVSVDFVNNGKITVTSGTLEFLKGTLTNNGTINGKISFDSSGDELITAETSVKKSSVSAPAASVSTSKAVASPSPSSSAAVSLMIQAAATFGIDQGSMAIPAYGTGLLQATSLGLLGPSQASARHLA
jgi:hypothetical protein